jgi:hypothetical protein
MRSQLKNSIKSSMFTLFHPLIARILSMSQPLLPSILPPEVRSRIFVLLDNKPLALRYPEVFRAIAPQYLRTLSIGRPFNLCYDTLQTQLADTYPTCGGYAQELALFTDVASVANITKFLESFPSYRQLQHLRIEHSIISDSFKSAESLPYLALLQRLVASSPTLTRLSFGDVYHSSSLIMSALSLTRLDIPLDVLPEPGLVPSSITFPPQLEILSLTPAVAQFISFPPPPTLRLVIIYADNISLPTQYQELLSFISQSSSITSLGLVDNCM